MPQIKLTDAFITAYRAPKGCRIEIADARCIGLSLRVTAAGAKSFSFRYRPREGGNPQRVAIGDYPAVKLGKARAQADKMRA
ncbi:MAG TPA: Arm DNA-binding domain-containing protein, partial [Allosphingosinicella sp.]|nr:Arm DNA-binding domain-containing protein [Allosphingosinicella sp.]